MKISSFKPKRKMNNHVVGDFIQQKTVKAQNKIHDGQTKRQRNYFQCSSRTYNTLEDGWFSLFHTPFLSLPIASCLFKHFHLPYWNVDEDWVYRFIVIIARLLLPLKLLLELNGTVDCY